MGNIESVDGQSEMKHHIMPLKVPMPDPTELEEKFAIVLVSGPLNLSWRPNFQDLVKLVKFLVELLLFWLEINLKSQNKSQNKNSNNGRLLFPSLKSVIFSFVIITHIKVNVSGPLWAADLLNEPTCAVPPLTLRLLSPLSPAVLLSPLKSDNSAFGWSGKLSSAWWERGRGRGGFFFFLSLVGEDINCISLTERTSRHWVYLKFSRCRLNHQKTTFSEFPQNSHTRRVSPLLSPRLPSLPSALHIGLDPCCLSAL